MIKQDIVMIHIRSAALWFCIPFILNSCVHQSTQNIPLDTTPLDTAFMHTFTTIHIEEPGTGGFYDAPLTWVADSFYVYRYNKWHSDPQPPQYREDYRDGDSKFSINGKISLMNEIVGSCSDSYRSFARNHWGNVYEDVDNSRSISYKLIPLITRGSDSLVFSLKGESLKSHILNLDYHNRKYVSESNFSINDIKWDTIPLPGLTITFYR